MFKTVANLIIQKKLRLEEGKIILFDEAGGMLPMTSFVNIIKLLEKIGKENVLYVACKESGQDWNQKMFERYKTDKAKYIFEWGEKAVTLAGWGSFKIHKYDFDKNEFVYRLYKSTLAEYYGKSKQPIDQIARGLFAGSACFLTDKKMDAVETKCIAMGDSYCEFEIKERKKFDLKNALIKKQLA